MMLCFIGSTLPFLIKTHFLIDPPKNHFLPKIPLPSLQDAFFDGSLKQNIFLQYLKYFFITYIYFVSLFTRDGRRLRI